MPASKDKSKKASKAAASSTKAGDEIDSIFANPQASTSKTTLGELAAKKPKKKRKKPSAPEKDEIDNAGVIEQEEVQAKRPKPKVVEVVDTSSNLSKEVQKQPLPNDVEELMDSRGNKSEHFPG